MLIDLPIEELKKYQGRSPRPADFDEYWDESLAELAAVDPGMELIPSRFKCPGAECFELFFTGIGGARVHAKLARPARQDKPSPAVVRFGGYCCPPDNWVDLLSYVAAGMTIASLDTRGQFGESEDSTAVKGTTVHGHIVRGLADPDPKKLLYRSIFLDTRRLAELVMQMPNVDAARVGAWGGSQGGALTLACAALTPGLNRAAARFPFLCDFRRVWEMDLAKDAYEELRAFFRNFDPTHSREDEIFLRLGYIDIQNLAPRIRCRTLMMTGLMDTICPPSSQFAAYNKITAPKEVIFYHDYGHEEIPTSQDCIFEFMMEMYK